MAEVNITLKAATAQELNDMGSSAVKQGLSEINPRIQGWLDANNNGEPLEAADIDGLSNAQKTQGLQILVQALVQRLAGNWDRNAAREAAGDAVVDPGDIDNSL